MSNFQLSIFNFQSCLRQASQRNSLSLRHHFARIARAWAIAAICATTAFRGAMAQNVLAPPSPEFSQQLPLPPGARPVEPEAMLAANPLLPSAPYQGWLDWGPVNLHPHLLYRVSYGNGIQAQPGQPENTLINQISPGILFDVGEDWHLDYTPTMRFYSSSAFRNTTDQAVRLNGGTRYKDWSFGLAQSYVSSSQPLVETASQTAQQNFVTALNASWFMSSKLTLELGLNQNFRNVDGNQQAVQGQPLVDTRNWSTLEWLNYQFWPKLGVALGVGGGYDNVSAGSDMTFEQLQARINWQPGTKLLATINGGFEDRQFLDSGAPNALNPIYGLTILYQLFEGTAFSLNGSRTVAASYYEDQITETATVTAGVRQRLFKQLFLDVNGGFTSTSYQATTTTTAVNRQDDYAVFNVRLSCPFLKRGTVALFYNWSDNSSNDRGYSYQSNQGGLELGYHF
jgi:hypothetical protein